MRHQRWHERRGERRVERAEQDAGDDARFDDDLFRNAGARVDDAHAWRCGLQPLHQGADARRQIGMPRATGRVALAVSQQLVERALGVAGGIQGQAHVRRRDAVENHRADAVAMLPQVDQRRPRAVRAAVQVDALVAKMRAHLIEIVHGDGRRVQADVGVISLQAAAQPLERGLL